MMDSGRPRKSPLRRTPPPLLPPMPRSRSAHLLTAAAARGRFALPACTGCGAFVWPVTDVCPKCLGPMALRDAEPSGELLSLTDAGVPVSPYFRARAPWRVGLVKLDCGPVALTHLHPAPVAGDRVALSLMLDRAGQAVLHAGPAGVAGGEADPARQEMTASPRGRRVLITDARHVCAVPLARALLQAGANAVTLGLPESWKPFAQRAALESLSGVQVVPLDVGSDRSVGDLAAQIAGKVEILINTADMLRPGGVLAPGALVEARAAMEIVAFGQLRLVRSFGPAMMARGGDGSLGAVAWVNLHSVFADAVPPGLAGYAAAHAAGMAMSRAVRAELGRGGIRVMTVVSGPTEDDWFDGFHPPRVTGGALARAIVSGLNNGLEEVVVGDIARDLTERLAENRKAVERDLAQGQI